MRLAARPGLPAIIGSSNELRLEDWEMAGDGSAALGAPEIAGTMVNPQGLTKKMTIRTAGAELGGIVGSVAAGSATGGLYQGAPDVPVFGRVGYVAVSETEVALIKTKAGPFKMHVTDEALARVPRSELGDVELEEGKMISHLMLGFTNGVRWEFDVPKMGKKNAKEFVSKLGGRIT